MFYTHLITEDDHISKEYENVDKASLTIAELQKKFK